MTLADVALRHSALECAVRDPLIAESIVALVVNRSRALLPDLGWELRLRPELTS